MIQRKTFQSLLQPYRAITTTDFCGALATFIPAQVSLDPDPWIVHRESNAALITLENRHVSKVGTWNNAKSLFNNAVCEAALRFVYNGQLQPWFDTGQEFLENATKIHRAAMLLQQLKSLWRRENVQMEKMRQQQLHSDSGLWKIPETERHLYRTQRIYVDNAFKKAYQK